MHPSHEDQIIRLNKIEGQVKGIRKMIENRRYCVDILTQTKAAISAIRKVELGILENHIQHCLKNAVEAEDESQVNEKISEIMKLLNKRM